MSAMDDSTTLSRYLLHDVSEREREEIEGRYFRDPEALAQLDAVEGDLIDAYVRRELSREQRARFEKYFLCTRSRRERLRMAEALQMHLPRPRTAPRLLVAIAASLLVVALLGIWLWTRTAPPAVVHKPAPPVPSPVDPPRAPVTLAVTLWPGIPRDAASSRTIALGPGVEQLQISALVEVEGEWRDLRASLRSTGWTASNLTLSSDRTVTVTIPASQLPTGEHILVLTSGTEALGDYAFVIAR